MAVVYDITNSNAAPAVPGWSVAHTVGRWNLFAPDTGPYDWQHFRPDLLEKQVEWAKQTGREAVTVDMEHAFMPPGVTGQPGLASGYLKLPDARVAMSALAHVVALLAQALPGRRLYVYNSPTSAAFALAINAAILEGVLPEGTNGGTKASATAYVGKWQAEARWELDILTKFGALGAPDLYWDDSFGTFDVWAAYARVKVRLCSAYGPAIGYLSPYKNGATVRLPAGWLKRMVDVLAAEGVDAGVWRADTAKDAEWIGEFKPTPPPAPPVVPPPPPPIVVGPDNGPPAELRVGRGDVATRIQGLIDEHGKAYLQYGGDFKTAAPIKVPRGALVGTYGNKADGRPVIRAGTDAFVLSGAHGATLRGFSIRPKVGIPGEASYDPDWAVDFKDPVRGVEINGTSNDVTLDDLDIRGFEVNVSLWDTSGKTKNLTILNCTLTHALSRRGFTGHGILAAGYDGLLIDRCRLLFNGWFKGIRSPGIHTHGLYGSAEHGAKNLVCRDTLTIGNSSYGLQCRVPASKIQRCLSIDDALAFLANGAGDAELVDSGAIAGHYHVMSGTHGQQLVEWCAERGTCARNIFVGGPPPVAGQFPVPAIQVHRRPFKESQPWQWQGKIHCEARDNLLCGVNAIDDKKKPYVVTDETEAIEVSGKNVTCNRVGNKVRKDKPDLKWVDAFVKRALDGKANAVEGLGLLRTAVGL